MIGEKSYTLLWEYVHCMDFLFRKQVSRVLSCLLAFVQNLLEENVYCTQTPKSKRNKRTVRKKNFGTAKIQRFTIFDISAAICFLHRVDGELCCTYSAVVLCLRCNVCMLESASTGKRSRQSFSFYFWGMFAWLAKASPRLEGQYAKPKTPGLPDLNSSMSSEETAAAFEGANKAADDLVFAESLKNKKCGRYPEYSDDKWVEDCNLKYAVMDGTTKSGQHFSKTLGARSCTLDIAQTPKPSLWKEKSEKFGTHENVV